MPMILVVEDDQPIRDVVRDVLDDEGYAVTGVANGRLALDVLATITPDLIITDIMMPVMDGFQLCAAVRAQPATAHIPIIVMSAASNRLLADQSGAAAFLAKPFQLITVIDTVQAILNAHP